MPWRWSLGAAQAAAFSHIAVSKALTIIGMFMPKFGLMPFFATDTFTGGLATAWLSAWLP